MLQTVSTQSHQAWPASIINPIAIKAEPWERIIRNRREAPGRLPTVNDVAVLYPEAVVASSDTFAWQNIRALQLRHTLNEMVVPSSDNHCLVLNLSAPIHLTARLGKRNFEGRVRAGEVAIIPAGAGWSCQSLGSHPGRTLLLFLRPLFVRKVVEDFEFSYKNIVLTPQIGFRSKHIRHIAMSLLHQLNESKVVGRLYADSLAVGIAMQLVRRYSSLKDIQIGH